MDKYLSLLLTTACFTGFKEDELHAALSCLEGQIVAYTKKEVLIHAYDRIHSIGIILEGEIYLSRTNIRGDRQIFMERTAGDLFGEHCLWSEQPANGFEIEAASPCVILYIEKEKIQHPEKTTCPLRQRMIENLFRLLLNNNQLLYQKIDLFSQKNIREQILYYLKLQARKNNSHIFTIPFSRQEFADYLGVDRSAISRELSNMKKEQLIDYKGNWFRLK